MALRLKVTTCTPGVHGNFAGTYSSIDVNQRAQAVLLVRDSGWTFGSSPYTCQLPQINPLSSDPIYLYCTVMYKSLSHCRYRHVTVTGRRQASETSELIPCCSDVTDVPSTVPSRGDPPCEEQTRAMICGGDRRMSVIFACTTF